MGGTASTPTSCNKSRSFGCKLLFLGDMRLKHFNVELGSQIFLACSDTSRLRILHLILTNGEMCITDLERILEFTQTKTSRHLLYLKNSGILTSRKINQWAFYQIKDEVFDLIKQLLQWVSRDPVMQQDQQVFKNMYINRELSLNKLKIKPLSVS
ncbi:MAG: ArsR/SmtB family transcription factor [Flammeovirgaceae bacterium]